MYQIILKKKNIKKKDANIHKYIFHVLVNNLSINTLVMQLEVQKNTTTNRNINNQY